MNRLLKDPAASCTLSGQMQLIRTPCCCSGCCCKINGIAEPIENLPDWSTNSTSAPHSEDDSFGRPTTCSLCSSVAVQLRASLFAKHYISLRINPSLSVDITYDGAIRMKNEKMNNNIAINADSTMAAMHHECGQVYKNKAETDIEIYNLRNHIRNHKYAKLTGNAIKFRSQKSGVSFVTDAAGTKTCADTLIDLYGIDYTKRVFQHALTYGEDDQIRCNALVRTLINKKEANVETWEFKNNVTVYKEKNSIRVTRKPNIELEISSRGELDLSGEGIYMNASYYDRHFFVRSRESRVHYDDNKFVVRYNSQNAGFDESDHIFIS